jgi:hypothetical protein
MAISYKRDSKKLYKLTFMMCFFVSCYLEKKWKLLVTLAGILDSRPSNGVVEAWLLLWVFRSKLPDESLCKTGYAFHCICCGDRIGSYFAPESGNTTRSKVLHSIWCLAA